MVGGEEPDRVGDKRVDLSGLDPAGRDERGDALHGGHQEQAETFGVVFQQATSYQAPVWSPVDGEQRPMMHFDFQVGDLDSAVAEAVALGATVAAHQPQENVRVLLDPASKGRFTALSRNQV